jgi:hypothetical protein
MFIRKNLIIISRLNLKLIVIISFKKFLNLRAKGFANISFMHIKYINDLQLSNIDIISFQSILFIQIVRSFSKFSIIKKHKKHDFRKQILICVGSR